MGYGLCGRRELDTPEQMSMHASTTAGIQGLASTEQARRVSGWRKERGWEMVELKDHQQ